MKKLKNESELVKEALRVGAIYAEKRKAGKIKGSGPGKKESGICLPVVGARQLNPASGKKSGK